ncbi:hypothetical protein BEP19_05555 [Ammoniphilus oxalaticus]|uniref:Uncharacterized protein n=1 Tax=Ammoniphilus oxalaticus TaxID=66863 RepID=A0A419SIQ9_9BACL|nr:hypothetical protein [Ammoniphilus oxalaticus]RKD23893.1 hypothetical protein BEP19_05555 [Ammoniphilus oxalaticus]
MIKRELSRLNPFKGSSFEKRSYLTLGLIFVAGLVFILGAFLLLYEFKIKQVAAMEAQAHELKQFISEHEQEKERLTMPVPPNEAEALSYARKVPTARELPRILADLEQIANVTGINIESAEVNEVKPTHEDLVTTFLKELGELAKDMKEDGEGAAEQEGDAAPPRQRERIFITEPERFLEGIIGQAEGGNDKTDDESDGVTKIAPELEEYIPFGMIRFEVEATGTYHSLMNFLGLLRTNDRLTHVEKWEYQYLDTRRDAVGSKPVIQLSFKVFYYKQPVEFIPELPPLELETGGKSSIIVVPKSWIETPQTTTDEDEYEGANPEGTAEAKEAAMREAIKVLSEQIPVDPITKD